MNDLVWVALIFLAVVCLALALELRSSRRALRISETRLREEFGCDPNLELPESVRSLLAEYTRDIDGIA
jgi:hypothetical protein